MKATIQTISLLRYGVAFEIEGSTLEELLRRLPDVELALRDAATTRTRPFR